MVSRLDFRSSGLANSFDLILTENGQELYSLLNPLLNDFDLSFNTSGKTGELSWKMNSESTINEKVADFLAKDPDLQNSIRKLFLEMDALALFLKYLYKNHEKIVFTKNEIYNDFFEAPFVKNYLDRNGIDKPTVEGAKRRVPFLLNLLEAMGIIKQGRSQIELLGFYPSPRLFDFVKDENNNSISEEVSDKVKKYFNAEEDKTTVLEKSLLKEEYGKNFLTKDYYIKKI